MRAERKKIIKILMLFGYNLPNISKTFLIPKQQTNHSELSIVCTDE